MFGSILLAITQIREKLNNVVTHHGTVRIEDHYLSTASDSIEFHSAHARIGSSQSIGSTSFTILSNAAVSQPSTGQGMNVVSTSASDTSNGTGVQQITIDYFTAPSGTTGWLKKSEVVTLNGVTPVPTVNTDIYRIDRVHTNRVGTNGTPLGTITVKDLTNTILFAQMDIGNNIFERGIFYIPKGYQCVLTDMMIGISSNGGCVFRIFATEEDANGNTVTIGQLSIEMNGPATIDRSFNLPLVVSNPNSKNKAIGIAAIALSGTQSATGTIRFMLQPIE
jgi:hypothetical protein